MNKILIFLIITPIFCFSNALDNTFARYLENEGDIKSSIIEYKRLLVDSSLIYNTDSIYIKISQLNMRIGNYKDALYELNKLENNDKINNLKGISYMMLGDMERARNDYFRNDTLIGISYILENRFNRAGKYIDISNPPKLKNPYLGLTLSMIVPGMGKVYAGRTFDGIYSFMLVGSSALSSYLYFRDNNRVFGYTYGVISALLYMGNLYGSYKACEIYNNYSIDVYKNNELIKLKFSKWF